MKLLKFILPLSILIFYNSNAFTKEQKKDCSSIDTSTGVGMYEKWKCEKGAEGFKKKVKKFFKKKN